MAEEPKKSEVVDEGEAEAPLEPAEAEAAGRPNRLKQIRETFISTELEAILEALEHSGWNQTRAAEMLGVVQGTLGRAMQLRHPDLWEEMGKRTRTGRPRKR